MAEDPDRDGRGPREREVDALFDGPGFLNVSFEQYSPNGANVLAQVYFLLCPVCRAMVPSRDPDRPEYAFDLEHRYEHQRQARVEDRLNALVEAST